MLMSSGRSSAGKSTIVASGESERGVAVADALLIGGFSKYWLDWGSGMVFRRMMGGNDESSK